MNSHSTWRALVLVLAAGALASACGPDEVPASPDQARVSIEVRPNATGITTVALGGEPDEAALTDMVDTIDGEVFPGRPANGAVIDNGDLPLLRFTSTEVFEPGEAPTVEVDTRGLCDDVRGVGVRTLDVTIDLPSVPVDRAMVPDQPASDRSWHVRSCGDSPHGSVLMMPDPAHFWRELVLILVVVFANAALLVIGKRDVTMPRWLSIGLSAIGVAASLAFIVTHGATAGDHMEVAGQITHGANQMYFIGSLVVMLLGLPLAVAQPFYWHLPQDRRPRLRRRPPRAGNDATVTP